MSCSTSLQSVFSREAAVWSADALFWNIYLVTVLLLVFCFIFVLFLNNFKIGILHITPGIISLLASDPRVNSKIRY